MIFIVVFFIIGKVSAPLGMGRLGTQPFEVSETFSAPQCFEPLLAQAMIMLNGSNILLELMYFCICSSDFLVIGPKAIKLGCDSPVFEMLHMFQQDQELRIWPSKD
jgi:hypothetical protein